MYIRLTKEQIHSLYNNLEIRGLRERLGQYSKCYPPTAQASQTVRMERVRINKRHRRGTDSERATEVCRTIHMKCTLLASKRIPSVADLVRDVRYKSLESKQSKLSV